MGMIEDALTRRLGDKQHAEALAKSYRAGLQRWAETRTAGAGPVPTTLVSERVDLLLAVSVEAKKLLTEREIAALLRLTPATARRLSEEMRAMYEDTIQPFIYEYAFDGAEKLGVGEHSGITGARVAFASEAHLDAFMTEAKRTDVPVARKRGEPSSPWLVYIDKSFDLKRFGL